MAGRNYLAIDMGASSGRHCLGTLTEGRLFLEEIHRFENGGINMNDTLFWDTPRQWQNIVDGLRLAAAREKNIVSIGIDTWGVDFALLDRNDQILGNVVHYRDHRTDGALEKAFARVPRSEIFQSTGLQFMPINTLYQLLALQEQGSSWLEAAKSFLMVPDLFNFLLTGVKSNEFSNSTTTQCFDPRTNNWSWELLSKFRLPSGIFGDISLPGTILGRLRSSVLQETGLASTTQIVLPGTHDTASAVMSVPARSIPGQQPDWAYLSLGTWALMGIESPKPIVNETVEKLNFTNEGGVGSTYRVLKNITGLWTLQECRRIWNQNGMNLSWDELTRQSAQAPAFQCFINPDDPAFAAPTDMPEAIRDFCLKTGQHTPESIGEIARCVEESLALRFRTVLDWTETINGSPIKTLHIIGGGTKNRQLCQYAANATGRTVVAGPIEATAIGNIMMQAVADKAVADIAEAREVVRNSFPVEIYQPKDQHEWSCAYEKAAKIQ